jgi:NDP-sugar pyrophosphorylase family protein
VASGLGSAGALRAVAGGLVADAVAVLSADLVSDVPLGAVLAAHTVRLGLYQCTYFQLQHAAAARRATL